jgi:hypothetical protein
MDTVSVISFSDCGRYFTYTHIGASIGHDVGTCVIPVPTRFLKTKKQGASVPDGNGSHNVDQRLIKSQSKSISMLHRSINVSQDGKTVSTIAAVSEKGVSLTRKATQGTGSILLTALPRLHGLAHTRADVILQSKRGDAVKIVLNKEPQRLYDLAQSVEDHSPAIIERDPKFIEAPKLQGSLEWKFNGDNEECDVGDSKQSKRRKISDGRN